MSKSHAPASWAIRSRIRARRCCTATGCARSGSTAPTSSPTWRRRSSRRSSAGWARTASPAATSPFRTRKRRYRLVDRRERAADAIGAVNTVWYEDGALIGGNTDWLGIVRSLDAIHPGWDASPGKAVVLGAGGSARASVLRVSRARIFGRDRQPHARRAPSSSPRVFGARASAHGFDALPDLLAEADVLINNTSLGQAGNPPLEIDLGAAEAFGDRL